MPSVTRPLLLACAAALLSGCGGSTEALDTVDVYWPIPDSGAVSPHRVQVPSKDPLPGAIRVVAEHGGLPAGTALLGYNVAGKTTTVQLSKQFISGYPAGGSALEMAMIASLARTVMQQTKTAGLIIRVDGKAPDPLGAQFDFSVPITERDLLDGAGAR